MSIKSVWHGFAFFIAVLVLNGLPERARSESNGPEITKASYGANCQGQGFLSWLFDQSERTDDVTDKVKEICRGKANGKAICQFTVKSTDFGDPAAGCAKDFAVSFHCSDRPGDVEVSLPGEALGKSVELDCSDETAKGIWVLSATYGGNCKASPGNATILVQHACKGQTACDFAVDVAQLGDPAGGCGKEFATNYQCPSGKRFTTRVKGEANGKTTRLTCPDQ
jgi:hypothetical protein